MLSEKRKKEIENSLREGDEVVEYLREKGLLKKLNLGSTVFLEYVSSLNLIRHSRTLNRWTKVMALTALGMICLALAQLVALLIR